MDNASQIYDTAVIGGGPAGLTAAIALAATGARTALLARRVPYADNRTTALLGASTDLLERLEVWSRCSDKAAALRTMRLVDDTGRLIRAPEVRFTSDEIGLEQFGYNIASYVKWSPFFWFCSKISGFLGAGQGNVQKDLH
jgi:2-octaprenyl-6-methoxyphenol hydroxylase